MARLTPSITALCFVCVLIALLGSRRRPTGLPVKLAKAAACGLDSRQADIILSVSSNGHLTLNEQEQKPEKLDSRLREMFQYRAERVVFVMGSPDVPFEQVAKILDIAARQATYISLLTPSVLASTADGDCLDPNVPLLWRIHPRQPYTQK